MKTETRAKTWPPARALTLTAALVLLLLVEELVAAPVIPRLWQVDMRVVLAIMASSLVAFSLTLAWKLEILVASPLNLVSCFFVLG